MLELRILVDDIDYDSIAEYLIPAVTEKLRREEKGGILGNVLAGNPDVAASVARTVLGTMSQEQKDQLLVQLVTKNREKLLPCVTRWLGDAHPYTVRFAIEMLMTHYLREDFSPEYPAWVAAVESDHYYIRMMQAWYFATALAFRYEEILPYLTEDRLSPWVRQKTIQKAVESFRVPPEHKAELKALRR